MGRAPQQTQKMRLDGFESQVAAMTEQISGLDRHLDIVDRAIEFQKETLSALKTANDNLKQKATEKLGTANILLGIAATIFGITVAYQFYKSVEITNIISNLKIIEERARATEARAQETLGTIKGVGAAYILFAQAEEQVLNALREYLRARHSASLWHSENAENILKHANSDNDQIDKILNELKIFALELQFLSRVNRREFDKARIIAKKMIVVDKNNHKGYNYIGYIYSQHSQTIDNAIKSYEISRGLGPGHNIARVNLSELYFTKAKFKESIAVTEELYSHIQFNPSHLRDVHIGLPYIYSMLSRYALGLIDEKKVNDLKNTKIRCALISDKTYNDAPLRKVLSDGVLEEKVNEKWKVISDILWQFRKNKQNMEDCKSDE